MKVAIIPARGGSKRIPNKNMKMFHGKPIIYYAIKTAIESNLFDEVFVSTDNKEIAQFSIKNGAKVPTYRSSKNADDYATTSEVLMEVINFYTTQNKKISMACCIYPTSPLVKPKDLILANEVFEKQSIEVLISSVKFSFPVQRGFFIFENKEIGLIDPEAINKRSQDLAETYHDAGAFYLFNPQAFLKTGSLWKGKIGAYILSEIQSQDIDTIEDWKLAELKYEYLQSNK